MTEPFDPTSGYQPSGGWGYQEWGAAGQEAWDQAGQATAAGDSTTAAHWTEIARQSDQMSHETYVAGGPGYGWGGDTSGSNDGTYWGTAGGAGTPAEVPSYESAVPSYETGATTYDTGASTYDSGASTYDTGVSTYDTGASAYETGTTGYDSGVSTYDSGSAGVDTAADVTAGY